MKLSGKHNTDDVIGIARVPVVHVRTLRIALTNVDEVAIRRLLRCSFPSISPERNKFLSCIFLVASFKRLLKKRANSFISLFLTALPAVHAGKDSEGWKRAEGFPSLLEYQIFTGYLTVSCFNPTAEHFSYF